MPPDVTTLAACALACANGKDGRSRRWPMARCAADLVATGTPPVLAAACAAAMVAVGLQVQRSAQRAAAQLSAGVAG